MKKYITLAALFAAGTAFANAADEDYIKITTLANVATSTYLSDINLTASDFSLDTSTTDSYTAGGYLSECLRPAVNVGNGGTWDLNFTITNGSSVDVTLNKFSMEVFTFNSKGTTQANNTNRYFNFILKNKEGTTNYGTFEDVLIAGNKNGSLTTKDFDLLSSLTIASNSSVELLLAVSVGDSNPKTDGGSFVGLKSITLAIPEPSAFGLLAGLGALALVGTRRRRK